MNQFLHGSLDYMTTYRNREVKFYEYAEHAQHNLDEQNGFLHTGKAN